MMTNFKILLAGVVALSVVAFSGAAPAAPDVATALKQTQSQSWQTRATGVKAIEDADDAAHPLLSDAKMRGTLIALLQRETGFHDRHLRYGGRYMDYYSDLLAQVASWQDTRALPVLMDVRVITTGNIATRGVAQFGDAVVAPVIARYKASGNILERVSMLSVLDHVAGNGTPLSAGNAQAMRATLLNAARDNDPLIRIGAVRGLAIFKDSFTRQTLSSLAARDPFMGSTGLYMVRDEAARALAAMNAKKRKISAG